MAPVSMCSRTSGRRRCWIIRSWSIILVVSVRVASSPEASRGRFMPRPGLPHVGSAIGRSRVESIGVALRVCP